MTIEGGAMRGAGGDIVQFNDSATVPCGRRFFRFALSIRPQIISACSGAIRLLEAFLIWEFGLNGLSKFSSE